MASDLSAEVPFSVKRAAMNATAGNCSKITLPDLCEQVVISFTTDGTTADSGRLASAGTDGAAIGNDVFPIGSGAAYRHDCALGGHVLYLAGDTNSSFAHLAMYGSEAR